MPDEQDEEKERKGSVAGPGRSGGTNVKVIIVVNWTLNRNPVTVGHRGF